MKIGAIIQARTSSSRLPRKVLKPLPYGGNICVLQQVIRRVSKSELISEIIVATSDNEDDSEIVDVAKTENVKYFRGSLENVLERYYLAALKNDLDVVVRITSDCPCADYTIIDKIIRSHFDENADYTSNALKETFPRGIDCEVINFNVLKKAYENATEKYEKEHVTPYIYKTHPDEFNINIYTSQTDLSDIRITLDTPQDYAMICSIYDNLYDENNFFTLENILNLFEMKPWIRDINSSISQKKVCSTLEEELEEAVRLCETQDLSRAADFINRKIGE